MSDVAFPQSVARVWQWFGIFAWRVFQENEVVRDGSNDVEESAEVEANYSAHLQKPRRGFHCSSETCLDIPRTK